MRRGMRGNFRSRGRGYFPSEFSKGTHTYLHPLNTKRLWFYLPTGYLKANFQPYISFFYCKKYIRLKSVANECDQCVWAVCVVTGHGQWMQH